MPTLPEGLDGGAAVHEVMNGCSWLLVARKAATVCPAAAHVGYRS